MPCNQDVAKWSALRGVLMIKFSNVVAYQSLFVVEASNVPASFFDFDYLAAMTIGIRQILYSKSL